GQDGVDVVAVDLAVAVDVAGQLRLAGVADPVAVAIGLVGIERGRAIVAAVGDAVVVGVRRRLYVARERRTGAVLPLDAPQQRVARVAGGLRRERHRTGAQRQVQGDDSPDRTGRIVRVAERRDRAVRDMQAGGRTQD